MTNFFVLLLIMSTTLLTVIVSSKPIFKDTNHVINKDEMTKSILDMRDVVIKYVKEKHPQMEHIKQEKLINGLMKKLRQKLLKMFKKKLILSPWKGKDDTYARMLR